MSPRRRVLLERMSGTCTGHGPVVQNEDTVDEHVARARRILMWIPELRGIANVLEIQDRDIDPRTFTDDAAILQTHPLSSAKMKIALSREGWPKSPLSESVSKRRPRRTLFLAGPRSVNVAERNEGRFVFLEYLDQAARSNR